MGPYFLQRERCIIQQGLDQLKAAGDKPPARLMCMYLHEKDRNAARITLSTSKGAQCGAKQRKGSANNQIALQPQSLVPDSLVSSLDWPLVCPVHTPAGCSALTGGFCSVTTAMPSKPTSMVAVGCPMTAKPGVMRALMEKELCLLSSSAAVPVM